MPDGSGWFWEPAFGSFWALASFCLEGELGSGRPVSSFAGLEAFSTAFEKTLLASWTS